MFYKDGDYHRNYAPVERNPSGVGREVTIRALTDLSKEAKIELLVKQDLHTRTVLQTSSRKPIFQELFEFNNSRKAKTTSQARRKQGFAETQIKRLGEKQLPGSSKTRPKGSWFIASIFFFTFFEKILPSFSFTFITFLW